MDTERLKEIMLDQKEVFNRQKDLISRDIEMYGLEPMLFFDEIENIGNWEKFINCIHEKGIKIFITGSNASLLSSEISTGLTGRNKVLELYLFSFSEFLRAVGHTYDPHPIPHPGLPHPLPPSSSFLTHRSSFPLSDPIRHRTKPYH